ncbi:MAG: triose-phosphate isomerase, partial [Planctomycetia bacterium]|nr:triose-phosphate isomerase [Planctomycetia bacterium]
MRKTFVAGNWKMNTTRASAVELAEGLKQQVGALDEVEVGLCPPFVYLEAVAGVIAGSNIQLAGQNLHFEASGAFTAETSGAMLKDIGCRYVIVGHSERRHIFGEPDELIAKKVPAAFDAALVPILCVGETLEEREADQTEAVVRRQVTSALTPLPAERAAQIVLAYEPVWAIGTGLTATPEQAQEVHR